MGLRGGMAGPWKNTSPGKRYGKRGDCDGVSSEMYEWVGEVAP